MTCSLRAGLWACLLGVGVVLGGCGKSLSELLDESQIYSVRVDPQPVPAPVGGSAVPFGVIVEFDSNRDGDDLRLWVPDPHDGGRLLEIGFVGACTNGSGEACGSSSNRVECFSTQSTRYGGERELRCGSGIVSVPPGTHRLRVEIQRCGFVTGCDSVHDSYELNFVLQ